MQDVPHDVDTHTVFVRGVEFEVSTDVFIDLLGIPQVSESFPIVDKAEDTLNVGTSRSSTYPIEADLTSRDVEPLDGDGT